LERPRDRRPVGGIALADARHRFSLRGGKLDLWNDLHGCHDSRQRLAPYLLPDAAPRRQFGQVLQRLLDIRLGDVERGRLAIALDQLANANPEHCTDEDVGIDDEPPTLHAERSKSV
jgi:hypothetical protein